MKSRMSLVIAALVAGVLTGTHANAQTEITLGHVGEPGSLFDQSAQEFAKRANEKFGDMATVSVYGSSQLGSDSDMMKKLKLGTLDLSIPSTIMSSQVPMFGLFEMPYLVQDRAHMAKIRDEIVVPTMSPMAEEEGYRILGVWENGFRQITNNVRPIVKPEDLQGIKLRTPAGQWRVRMFEAYGANPSPLALSEVFVALQTGVMDGQENPYAQIFPARFYEVQTYLSKTGHVFTPAFLVAGRSWSGMDPEIQTILEETAKEVEPFVSDLAQQLDDDLLAKLTEAGMEVNEVDKEAFIAASTAVYEEFAAEVPGAKELVDAAQALATE